MVHRRTSRAAATGGLVAAVLVALAMTAAPVGAQGPSLQVGQLVTGPGGSTLPVSGVCPTGTWSSASVAVLPRRGSGVTPTSGTTATPPAADGSWTVSIPVVDVDPSGDVVLVANCEDADGNRVDAGLAAHRFGGTVAAEPTPTDDPTDAPETEVLGAVVDRDGSSTGGVGTFSPLIDTPSEADRIGNADVALDSINNAFSSADLNRDRLEALLVVAVVAVALLYALREVRSRAD